MAGGVTIADREGHFIAQVPQWGAAEGCWEWSRCLTRHGGYGRFYNGTKEVMAHHFAWVMVNGPLPEGRQLNHTCDNPRCVRPSHLWVGTQSENMQDMAQKGRGRSAQVRCSRGHEFSETARIAKSSNGGTRRICRKCDVIRQQERRKAAK